MASRLVTSHHGRSRLLGALNILNTAVIKRYLLKSTLKVMVMTGRTESMIGPLAALVVILGALLDTARLGTAVLGNSLVGSALLPSYAAVQSRRHATLSILERERAGRARSVIRV